MDAPVRRYWNHTAEVPCGSGLVVLTVAKRGYDGGVVEWSANATLYPWDSDDGEQERARVSSA